MLATLGSVQQPPNPWDSANTPRFQTLKFLGKGGQGFVQLAYDNLHQQRVAIKYIDRGWSRGFYKYVLRETLNHQQLSLCKHPHIVEFHEVFLTPSYLAVVMEYVNGTNLQHYLEAAGGKLPEDVSRFIFQQLVVAVDFCHRKGKVNRDIKLANILLQEGHLPLVKLCDFGFSKDKFDDSEPQTQIGTALFTAPEIFTNVPGQVYDAEAADVWSCGVVLFVMLFGCHPFLSLEDTQHRKHAQVMKLIENAVRGNVQVPPGAEELYPQALDLVRRILVSAPGQRCKLPTIMAHPWFQDKLPPGALLLNTAYLAMENPVGEPRQTPEEVHAIITAALSAGAGDPEMSESTSLAAAGSGVEVTSASEVSRAVHPGHPGAPALQQPQQHAMQSQAIAGPLGSLSLCMGTPTGPMHLMAPGGLPGAPVGTFLPACPPGHQQHPQHPQHQHQPPAMQQQYLGPAHPQNLHQASGGLPPHAHGNGTQRMPGMELSAAQQGQQLAGSEHTSGSSHAAVAIASGMSQGPMLGQGAGPSCMLGVQPHPQVPSPGRRPGMTADSGQQPLGGMGYSSPGPLAGHPASPLTLSLEAGMAVSGSVARSGNGHALSMGGPPGPLMQSDHTDMAEVASGMAGAAPGSDAGQPGAAGGGDGSKPNPMDVSGCILYDSSLLYKLDLQTGD